MTSVVKKETVKLGMPEAVILANRYTSTTSTPHLGGYTLIFLHGSGAHKETWEPTIDRLLSGAFSHPKAIHEIWSIEDPTHGESGVLNEASFQGRVYDTWSAMEYTRAVHSFLTAGSSRGACVDFLSRRLVGIGHSMGGCCLPLLLEMDHRLPFEALIFVEATIADNNEERRAMGKLLTGLTWAKRDTWASRKSAEKDFAKNPVYQTWDKQALELYLKYTLRTHPAAKFEPPFSFKGVTPVVSKDLEAAMTRASEPIHESCVALSAVSLRTPIFFIFGDVDDLASRELKQSQLKMVKREPASVVYIAGAGHMVPQQAPEDLAKVLLGYLGTLSKAKL